MSKTEFNLYEFSVSKFRTTVTMTMRHLDWIIAWTFNVCLLYFKLHFLFFKDMCSPK